MRKVELKRWRDQIREQDQASDESWYLSRRRWLNKRSLLGFAIALALFFGLGNRFGQVLALALVFFGGYLYFRARATAEGLRVSRRAPARATERDTVTVELEIENRAGFAASGLVLTDCFHGSKAATHTLWLEEPIPPLTSLKASYRKTCDAGMGAFAIGPLTVTVTDPLGVFEFVVSVDDTQSIEVYPRLEPIPDLPLAGSRESFLYGIYDLPTRGASVNFAGIREYRRGDPLRHIAWRLSARNGRFLVKEFEKIANTELTILLNMDEIDHMGAKSDSTWEYAKDAALAILTQQMANGNSVQLATQSAHVELGRGEAHANLIARVLFNIMPSAESDRRNIIERYRDLIPRDSTVVFISPVCGTDTAALARELARLRLNGAEVICLLINPAGFVADKAFGEERFVVESTGWKADAAVAALRRQCVAAGLRVHVLECGTPIGRTLSAAKGAPR